MGKEIEKKFLIKNQDYKKLSKGITVKQGYLSRDPDQVVRVRVYGSKGFITVKGKNIGTVRSEYEYEIPFGDAEEIIDILCERPIIEKYRYHIEMSGFVWEVDQFLGENEGLIIAEIELPAEDTPFPKPDWIGEEVSGDPKYFNSNLVKRPFKNW